MNMDGMAMVCVWTQIEPLLFVLMNMNRMSICSFFFTIHTFEFSENVFSLPISTEEHDGTGSVWREQTIELSWVLQYINVVTWLPV